MLKSIRLLVCLVVLAASAMVVLTPTSFAEPKKESQAKKEEVVYVTKRGKKYHKEDCRFIKNRETISMDKKEAEAKGLTPCGRCFKEEE